MLMDKRLLNLITPSIRRWMGVVVFTGWLVVLTNVTQILLIGRIIDRQMAVQSQPGWMLPAFSGLLIIRALAVWTGKMAGHKAAASAKINLRDRLYDHITRLGPSFLSHERTGALTNTAVEGVENLEVYFGQYLPQLILGLTLPLILCIAIITTADWATGLILILSQPLIPLSLMLVQRKLKSVSNRYWHSANQLSARFLDSLQGLPTLKLFNQSKAWGEKLHTQTEKLRKDTMRLLAVSQISLFGIDLISSLGISILTGVIVLLRMQAGMLTLGKAAALLLLSIEIARPLALLGSFFHAGSSGVAAAQSIFQVLETQQEVTEVPNAIIPASVKPGIRFENVHLSYEKFSNEIGGSSNLDIPGRQALSDITFTIKAGETAALVGPSGAGKSSIFNLLLRFYDPQQGRIFLGGYPINTLSLKWLRSQFTLVAQDPYLFFGTVSENLRIAKPNATQAELESAAKIAQIHNFISAQPQGYETLIGERGLTVSGGQLQRIAIARAILKDAPILLLDEATSHMDGENEMGIQESLQQLMMDKTVLIIAHRLSTVRHADHILVMDKGQIVEQGKHEDLGRKNGMYAHLMAAQQEIHGMEGLNS